MSKFVNVSQLSTTQRVPTLIQCEVLAGDASATFRLPIAAGSQIHKVSYMITRPFAVSAGTVSTATLTVGRASAEGNTAADYTATAYFNLSAANLFNSGNPNTAPQVSSAAPFVSAFDTALSGAATPIACGDEFLTVVWSQSNAALGRILIFVELSQVPNDGIEPTRDGLPLAASQY